MPKIQFTANLNRHLAVPMTDVAGDTVAAALGAVFEGSPGLRSYLLDDQGRLRRHVNVFVNGRMIADRERLSDPLGGDDEIYVFQALSGG